MRNLCEDKNRNEGIQKRKVFNFILNNMIYIFHIVNILRFKIRRQENIELDLKHIHSVVLQNINL